MANKEKLLKKFLENPTTLKADDIEELFIEA
jgi:hypothetical protein